MRTALFIITAILAFTTSLYLFLVAACVYTLRFSGFEMILLAVLVDAFLGWHAPLWGLTHTFWMIGLVIFIEYLKPHLRLYDL